MALDFVQCGEYQALQKLARCTAANLHQALALLKTQPKQLHGKCFANLFLSSFVVMLGNQAFYEMANLTSDSKSDKSTMPTAKRIVSDCCTTVSCDYTTFTPFFGGVAAILLAVVCARLLSMLLLRTPQTGGDKQRQ
eukprot:5904857-Amphidinium_carterae.1